MNKPIVQKISEVPLKELDYKKKIRDRKQRTDKRHLTQKLLLDTSMKALDGYCNCV